MFKCLNASMPRHKMSLVTDSEFQTLLWMFRFDDPIKSKKNDLNEWVKIWKPDAANGV